MGAAGDADGDSVPDFLLGTRRFGDVPGNAGMGRAELRSGKTGDLLAAYRADHKDDPFGFAMTALGNVDGDSRSGCWIPSPDDPFASKGQVSVVKFLPELTSFIRGDANFDGKVELSGVFTLVAVLYLEAPAGPCLMALDVERNDRIDNVDLVLLILYLFEGDIAPAPPFPDCGRYGGIQDQKLGCEASTCGLRGCATPGLSART